MLNKVLGTVSVGRAPKRSVMILLLLFIFAIGGSLVAQSAFAAGAADPTLVQTQDANHDGHIDGILLTFATPMNASYVPNGYSVAGYALSSPAGQWMNVQGGASTQLLLKLIPDMSNNGDTGVTPQVTYTTPGRNNPSVTAVGGQETSAGPLTGTTDSASPVLMQVFAKDFGAANTFNQVGDEMSFVFSEPVQIQGATTADKMKALDRALVFEQSRSSSATCNDANASTPNSTNFPQVSPGATANPIISDGSGADHTIRVRMVTGTTSSSILNVAIPGQCAVGIQGDGPSGATSSGITDIVKQGTPNNAAAQDCAGVCPTANRSRSEIRTAATDLKYDTSSPPVAQIHTQDLTHANQLGYIDAIRVEFEQSLVASTITNVLANKFVVALGSQKAHVVGVTPADSADAVNVRIDSVSWTGDQKPTISFDGTGCALQAVTPTGAGYTSCVASFGNPEPIQALNGVGPALKSAVTRDSLGKGFVDSVTVTLTKAAATSVTSSGWSVDGKPVSALTASGTSVLLTLSQDTLKTDATPAVSYDATAGNLADTDGIKASTQTVKAVDGAAPVAVKATALSSKNDGTTDRVTVEFSEPVDGSKLSLSRFSVDGVAPSAFSTSAIDPGTKNSNLITLAINHAGTGTFPVAYSGSMVDLSPAHNTNTRGFSFTAPQVIDKVKPVALAITTDPAGSAGAQTVKVTATFSEPVDTTVAPTVKVGTKAVSPVSDSAHNAQGFRTADTSKWDGTVSFVTTDCDAQNGCAKAITLSGFKDVAGNTGLDASGGTLTVDTVAPEKATGEAAAALQEAGQPNIASNLIGGHTKNLHVTATIKPGQVNTLGDASGGSATVLVDNNPLTPSATISGIDAAAGSIAVNTAFANAAALRSAIPEGDHILSIRLCDTAGNCANSAGQKITADYTPVTVTLSNPNSGTFAGGDKVCIQWSTVGNDLQSTELRYSRDGGATYPSVIDANAVQSAAASCPAGTLGYEWTVPAINTDALKVQVRTVDKAANDSAAVSASKMTVSSITSTVLSLTAPHGWVTNGTPAKLEGTLTGNGNGVGSKTVRIERRSAGSRAFGSIANVTTDNDGKFVYNFNPSTTSEYRAVFEKSGPYLASTSRVQKISVGVSIPTSVSSTSLRRGQTFTIRGNVWPGHAGKPVQLQTYNNRGWHTVSTQKLGRNSSFSFPYRSTRPVKLLFRVVFASRDAANTGNVSKSYLVTWR
ncbi:MAG: hypothetical protein NVSMB57_04090 [Actinomycetota bacterium]